MPKRGEQHTDELQLIRSNEERYQYAKDRGHDEYVSTARLNENFYLGGGLQWSAADKAKLDELKRPVIEKNHIWPAVNTALGIQLQSRVNMSFRPRRNGADKKTAEALSKLIRQICDDIRYRWIESGVFADGMVQQRGFFEFRMNFDTNINGDITCRSLDPMDVLPDPDANSYDPEDWQDLIVVKWLSVDDIAQLYGQEKADEVDRVSAGMTGSDPYYDYIDRSRFGDLDLAVYRDGYTDETGIKRVRVIDRQSRRLEHCKVLVYPFGDVVPMDGLTPEQVAAAKDAGACCSKRMVKKIRWTVSTADVLLHDDWSPYRSFTVVPYFPYFRRGKTRGMVDNARSPQEFHNKLESQILHIISTTANSGYIVEEGSLINLQVADLENEGAKTGLVIEYAKNSQKPEKIQPNQLPTGFDRLVERAEHAVKTITGMNDAVQGQDGRAVSGVAKQSDQFMGQAQLAGPIDNLARTRHMCARKLLELVQDYYTEERTVMITDDSDIASIRNIPLTVNQVSPAGEIVNDLTLGEYDVIITDMPTQATFQDNQFTQAMAMRGAGIQIPDASIIEMSSLTKKHEIAKALAEAPEPPPDPKAEAEAKEKLANAELRRAQTEKVLAETVGIAVDSQYSAVQTGAAISQDATIAPLADQLLRSAGYRDKDPAPIVPPQTGGVMYPEAYYGTGSTGYGLSPPNTDPTTPVPVPEPASPAVGQAKGIETVRFEDNI